MRHKMELAAVAVAAYLLGSRAGSSRYERAIGLLEAAREKAATRHHDGASPVATATSLKH
jgi:hypothetical protein